MFNKVKQAGDLLKLRSEAMAMQKKLKLVSESLTKGKYKVKVTGDQKVEYLEIDGESQPDLVKLINEALDKVQKTAAKQMIEEGGLSALLKGM